MEKPMNRSGNHILPLGKLEVFILDKRRPKRSEDSCFGALDRLSWEEGRARKEEL